MEQPVIYRSGEFEIDTQLYELRRGDAVCHLEPQVFDVLAYLVEHADRVVSKDELIERIWPQGFVSEATLSGRIMAARKGLGDTGREQRYIKTIHGRGFRFVGPVSLPTEPAAAPLAAAPVVPPPPPDSPKPPVVALDLSQPIGRESELAYLDELLARAMAGQRTMAFITGEAGIGKTTLVSAFVKRAETRAGCWIGPGECIEHRDVAEAYKPVLDALSRIGRGTGGARAVELMARIASTWLVQLPRLVDQALLEELRHRTIGTTRDRMLREFVELVEELGEERPVVLVLEDLHWSDLATLDVVAWMAHRREPARLLVLGTYRPAEVRGAGHPLDALQHELRVRGLCTELALPFLSATDVAAYLQQRFPGAAFAAELAPVLYERTEGSPLFITTVVEAWLAERLVVERDSGWELTANVATLAQRLPARLRELIAQQTARLPTLQREHLETASVAGASFSAAAVAAMTESSDDEVENGLTSLTRRSSFLADAGLVEWPDGTISQGYAFTHSLYREALYDQLPPTRRARLHRRLALRLQAGYGAHVGDHAVELAEHFAAGRDLPGALEHLRLAAERAMLYGAHRDALEQIGTALRFLERDSDPAARVHDEVMFQSMRATALIATEGFGSPNAEAAYARALELATPLDDPRRVAALTFDVVALREYQGDHQLASELLAGVELLAGTELPNSQEAAIAVPYHALCSCARFHQGAFAASVEHGRAGIALYERAVQEPNARFAMLGEDAGLGCQEWASLALGFMGYPDLALEQIRALVAAAAEPGRGYALASARTHAARIYQLREEPAEARMQAEEAVRVATERGYAYHRAVGRMFLGWAMAALGEGLAGIDEIQQGLEAHHQTGAALDRPYYLGLLADAQARSGQPHAALTTVDAALAVVPAEGYFYEAELHRLRGQLLSVLTPSDVGSAESALQAAIAVAERQEAKLLALRAAVNLARLHAVQGQAERGRAVLLPVVQWFGRRTGERTEPPELGVARELLRASY